MDKVEPYDCWEGVFNGCLEDKDLDNILSILDLDYPIDGFQEDGFTGEWDATKSHCLGPIPPDMPIDKSPPVLPPPMLAAKEFKNACNELVVFHTQSPVSVLEGNHGSSSIIKPCTSKRTRSKRARSSGLSSWLSMSTPLAATRKPRKAKGWRKKPSFVATAEGNEPLDQTKPLNNEVKKCVHCEVTKTPQWREGPAGPKTLCNACGVRYRSGRLFPEYRPAASPTFMPSVHSNSHRKVVEMRSKAKLLPLVGPTSMSPEMEFVPMSSHLFDHLC